MSNLLLIAVALALLVLMIRPWRYPIVARGGWRVGAGLLSMGTLAAAGFIAIRGSYDKALALAALGLVLVFVARGGRPAPQVRSKGPGPDQGLADVSQDEARALLGVAPSATANEIKAAHARLIRMVHPDKGGTSGLAAQLNAARDRLLGK